MKNAGQRHVDGLGERGKRFEGRQRLVVLYLAEVPEIQAAALGHLGKSQPKLRRNRRTWGPTQGRIGRVLRTRLHPGITLPPANSD